MQIPTRKEMSASLQGRAASQEGGEGRPSEGRPLGGRGLAWCQAPSE